jgi:hypothetical protein
MTANIRRSDITKFLNRFNRGTKREFIGKPIDFIGEPQVWEAVVLPLNYARDFKDLGLFQRCVWHVFGTSHDCKLLRVPLP